MSSPFPLPILFSAWGTGPAGQWEGSIGGLCSRAKQLHAKTLAVQMSQVTPRQVSDARGLGLFVVGWDVLGAGAGKRAIELGLQGVIPQIEGPGQYAGALAALDEIGSIPRAVITTYSGIDDPAGERWRELEARGVQAAFVECYAADDPVHADLPRMLAQGTVYGIPAAKLNAVVGTFRGELPGAYNGVTTLAPNLGVYLAEAMSETQFGAWATTLAEKPPPPAPVVAWWELRAGAALLHDERAITYRDGKTGLGNMLAFMVTHADTIRAAKAVTLKRVLR